MLVNISFLSILPVNNVFFLSKYCCESSKETQIVCAFFAVNLVASPGIEACVCIMLFIFSKFPVRIMGTSMYDPNPINNFGLYLIRYIKDCINPIGINIKESIPYLQLLQKN